MNAKAVKGKITWKGEQNGKDAWNSRKLLIITGCNKSYTTYKRMPANLLCKPGFWKP